MQKSKMISAGCNTFSQLAVRKKTNVRFDISCVEWVPWDERVASFYKRLIPKISNLTFVFITYSQLLKRLVDQVATSLDTGKHPTYVPNVCSLSTLTLFYEGGGQFCPTQKNFPLSYTKKFCQICARNLFSLHFSTKQKFSTSHVTCLRRHYGICHQFYGQTPTKSKVL